ncbi:LysR family transcriptional regulator [Sulfitobacter albidus]|uniref:LysR family transcriptional regulator n=1 Tax=Sulfitobacter albidus TaxID=2829501 RepID=A0A975PLE4_9RHOB|nr:LysR family transcriptional regulator [Sulfitobacter albidus]QUJ75633.1 LysR family transcriptional regulator [Sulfitobacter albidus]
MHRINLNALRVFALVVRHGTLQGAADALGLSRGAVSQRVKQLEADLGVTLLTREARGVTPTPAGEICARAVEDALARIDTALADVQGDGAEITVHLGASTASKWLMPRMAEFAAAFPARRLCTETHDAMLARTLGRHECALWPGAAPDPNPAHQSRALTELRPIAVCQPDLVPSDTPVTLEAVLDLPLLQDAHRRWDRLIAGSGRAAARPILNFDRAALAIAAAIGGHGVCIAADYLVADDLRQGRLVHLWTAADAPPTRWLYVSWSRDPSAQRDMAPVIDWLQDAFART